LYTSGTTGKPKGVMLSCKNVMTNTLQDHARLISTDQREEESFFSVLPLFHVFAQNTCLWLPVLIGAKSIIVKKIDRKLILKGLYKKPTMFLGFPALYGLLCLLKTAPLESVRMFISGADAMPDKIRMAFSLIYGRKICAGYGLTEAAPVIAVNHENESLATQFVGYVLPGIECDIRDDEEKSLPKNSIGTLWVKGDNVMMGYYKAEEQTQAVLKDGWLNTGDLGYINKDGYLAISGRIKDLIIHKGFNIYPQEIENVLLSHPAVSQAAVVGLQDSDTGQIAVAYVGAKGDLVNLDKDLRRLCSANLAGYKIPKKFVCLDKLPMNATGKIDKKQLINF
jgi:long-chain acyl-CoA synthetase